MRTFVRVAVKQRKIGGLSKYIRAGAAVAFSAALLAGCTSGPQPPKSAPPPASQQASPPAEQQSWWKLPTITLPTFKNPFSSDKSEPNAVALSPDMRGQAKGGAAISSSVAPASATPVAHFGEPAGTALAAAYDTDAARGPQINPREADALNDQAFRFYSQGKLAEAENAMLKAVALRPYDIQLRNNLAMIYGHQKRPREALEQFRLTQGEADACTSVAAILAADKDTAGARVYLGQALAADPNHARAKQALAALPDDDPKQFATKPWPAMIK